MEPVDALNPEQLRQERLQQAQSEFPNLFQEGGPLKLTDNLGQPGITGMILFAEYHPAERLPDGLGQWIRQRPDMEKEAPAVPGRWVDPRPEGKMVIKIVPSDDRIHRAGMLSAERLAFLKLREHHIEGAIARPIKMYGYGVTKDRLGLERPYLILEHAGEDFQSLDEYLGANGHLPEDEALEIAIELAVALNKLHRSQLVYGDINDQKLDNVFWNPKTRQLRLIDFSNMVDKASDYFVSIDYAYDRMGLGKFLFKLLTGVHPEFNSKYKSWGEQLEDQYKGRISVFTTSLLDNIWSVGFYKRDNPQDTRRLMDNLNVAYIAVKTIYFEAPQPKP